MADDPVALFGLDPSKYQVAPVPVAPTPAQSQSTSGGQYPMVEPHQAPDGSGSFTNVPDEFYADWKAGKPYNPTAASEIVVKPPTTSAAPKDDPVALFGLDPSKYQVPKTAPPPAQPPSSPYGFKDYVMHNATLGADEVVGPAIMAGAQSLISGTPYGQAYDQQQEQARQARKQWETDHPGVAIPAALLGGLVTGGSGLARDAAGQIIPAAKGVYDALFTSSNTLPGIARNVVAGTGLGAVSGFGMGEGGVEQRLQSAQEGAEVGGALPAALPAAGAAARLVGQAGRWAAGGVAPLVSEDARARMVGKGLLGKTDPNAIEQAPLPGVQLTLDQATNNPSLAADVDKWQGRQQGTATAIQTQNNAVLRDTLEGMNGGATPAEASADFTRTVQQSKDLLEREERRRWNAAPLNDRSFSPVPVQQAVRQAMATLEPGLKLGVTGQINNALGILNTFPKNVSVRDLNSIKSALWSIGAKPNPENAREAAVANRLAQTIHAAMDAQLTAPGVSPQARSAWESARDFTGESREATGTQRVRAADRTETESTTARRFLSPGNGAPEGAENIDQIRQVLRSFRSEWEALARRGEVDSRGIPYRSEDLMEAEQALKAHARSYIVSRLLETASLKKLDANGQAFLSPNSLVDWISKNKAWMRSSGLFSHEQLGILDAVSKTAEMLGRTQNLRAQVGSHTAQRLDGTFFNDRVMSRLKWIMRAGSLLGGYHEGGSIGAMAAVGAEGAFEQVLERAREATQEIMDRALGDPKFARELMMKATPGNQAFLSPSTRALLQRFEEATIQVQPDLMNMINSNDTTGANNAPK